MATAAMAFGERRFGAAYTVRIFVALGVLGLVVGLWAHTLVNARLYR